MAVKKKPPAAPKRRELHRVLHYRVASLIGGPPQKLSHLIGAAVERLQGAKALRFHDPNDAEHVHAMLKPHRRGDMICSMICDYTEGDSQPVLELDEKELEATLKSLAPRDFQHYIAALLFFGVDGDDVVLMQSRSLLAGHFENYLNWLLTSSGVLQNGERVLLSPRVPRQTRQLRDVQYVELREILTPSVVHEPGIADRLTLIDRMSEGLRAALRTEGTFQERLSESAALESGAVAVQVRLSVPRGERIGGLLDKVAHILRDTDDTLIRVKTRGGGELLAGELRLSREVRVKAEGGIPLLSEVSRHMEDWLRQLRQDGELAGDVD